MSKMIVAIVALSAGLAAASGPTRGVSDVPGADEPGPWAMVGDLLVARPIGIAITAVGTATYLAGLPFILAGGHPAEAGETLVVGPAKEAFVRCLGCTRAGWRSEYESLSE